MDWVLVQRYVHWSRIKPASNMFHICMYVIHTCFAFNSSDSGVALRSCGFTNLPNTSLCGGANTNFGLHAWINLLYFIVSSHSVHYGTYNNYAICNYCCDFNFCFLA